MHSRDDVKNFYCMKHEDNASHSVCNIFPFLEEQQLCQQNGFVGSVVSP